MTTNEGAERDRPDDSRVGTVAEEAARLVELLAAFGRGGRGASAPGEGPAAQTDGPAARTDEPTAPADGPAAPADGPAAAAHDPTADDGSERSPGACTCGGQRPAACDVCPLCQVIAFVQRVSPETIDRLAEVVELAATGLRDLAVVQRSRREQAQPPEGGAGA